MNKTLPKESRKHKPKQYYRVNPEDRFRFYFTLCLFGILPLILDQPSRLLSGFRGVHPCTPFYKPGPEVLSPLEVHVPPTLGASGGTNGLYSPQHLTPQCFTI